MERLAALEMECTGAGGRWNADNTCTSADEREMEAAQMACTSAGGRYESDGSCTSAADVEMQRLAAEEAACTGAGGRWESDNMCTSAAELVAEAAEANCVAGGGRYEPDGSCTSAADVAAEMEMERLAGLRTACEAAGGRFESDESCTSAADLAEMACTDASGRYESDGSCTSAAELAEMACTDAGGRFEPDASCTSAADLETERLAGLRTACENTGGRFESDESCTSAAELVAEAAEANCTAGGGRYESDGSCTSAAELAQMACTSAGGRYESDGSCTSAAELAEMACTGADGRWNDDGTCTTAAELAASKVAQTKKAAIAAEATAAAARPFDLTADPSDPPTATENYVLTVKHTGSAVEVKVLDGALAAKSDPMFERAATFGDGQMLVRNVGTDRKIIVLHTDIEADTDTPFSQAPGITLDQDTDTDYTGNESIRIQSTETADNYFDGMASSRFMYSGDADTHTITFRIADSAATPPVAASKFSGTYDGAPGTYECTGSTVCTVTVNKDDEVTAAVGEWNFTPAAGATVAVADDDYLTYGFWLDTTTKDGGIDSYDTLQTFAESSLPTVTAVPTTGSATYEGGAAGVYYHETKNEDNSLNLAASGRFTADVALKAYFEATTLRIANTVQGAISDFELDGGPDNSWNVELSGTISGGGVTGTASGMTGVRQANWCQRSR